MTWILFRLLAAWHAALHSGRQLAGFGRITFVKGPRTNFWILWLHLQYISVYVSYDIIVIRAFFSQALRSGKSGGDDVDLTRKVEKQHCARDSWRGPARRDRRHLALASKR
jgi:hypothetical protein